MSDADVRMNAKIMELRAELEAATRRIVELEEAIAGHVSPLAREIAKRVDVDVQVWRGEVEVTLRRMANRVRVFDDPRHWSRSHRLALARYIAEEFIPWIEKGIVTSIDAPREIGR